MPAFPVPSFHHSFHPASPPLTRCPESPPRTGDPAPLLPPAPPCGRILAEKGGDTMIPLNTEAAIKQSLEIAKILCQSPNVHISPNAEGANGIADFIETLQERFTRNPDTDQK